MKKSKESYTFLVDDSEDVKRFGYKYDQRNMLGYLVFRHNYYSDYRAEHNGFFFVSSGDIQNAVGISKNTVTMYAMTFLKDGIIDYSAGKRHHCSEYRLKFDFHELDVHNNENKSEVTDTEDNTRISGNQYYNGKDAKEITSESAESEEVTRISGNQYYESGENNDEKYENIENESVAEISGNQNTELRIKNEECSTTECSTENIEEKNEQKVATRFDIRFDGFWNVNWKGKVEIECAKNHTHIPEILKAAKFQLEKSPNLKQRQKEDPNFLQAYKKYVTETVAKAYGFPEEVIVKSFEGTFLNN